MKSAESAWPALKAVVMEALELPAGVRDAHLRARCPDPGRRAEAARLLRACERAEASPVLDRQAAELAARVVTEVDEQERRVPDALLTALGGRYTIERELGRGGMATVYLARDERHGRPVALKLLRPGPATDVGPSLAASRFEREIEIAARLSHPHILPLYDSGAAGGLLYYITPFVDGESLAERLKRSGPPPVDESVRLLRDVARALAHAHRQGVVHRDIKPANILLNQDCDALVADFGVAKALAAVQDPEAEPQADLPESAPGLESTMNATGPGLTDGTIVLGTPAYMAPEQLSGAGIDHRVDLYAFGALAYELLTGATPFAGRPRRRQLAAHLTEVPDPVATRRPDVPPSLAALVDRLLAKRPDDRPRDAAEVLRILDAAVAGPAGAAGEAPERDASVTAADELLRSAVGSLAAGDYNGALAAVTASLTAADSPRGRRLLGLLYYMDDRYEDCQRELQTAFESARRARQPREAARSAMDLAMLHTDYNGLNATGRGWLERARGELERAGPCVEWGYLELALLACDRPDADDLIESTKRALDIALKFADPDLEARAMADRGMALVTRGAAKEGFAMLDAVLAVVSTGSIDPIAASTCFCSMLTACDRAGDLRRAEEWTRVISLSVEALGDKPHILRTHCRVVYGSVLSASGRWSEAESLLLDALGPADNPDLCHRSLTIAHLADLRIDQGRVDEAADLLAPFEDRLTSCGPLARVHLLRGQPDLAAAVLRRGVAELTGDALRSAPLLLLLVDADLQRGDVDAARVAAARLATIAATSDLGSLRADAALAGARLLAALGDHSAAARSYADARGHLGEARPFQLASMRLELAGVLAAAGDVPGAIVEARAALACFERLGASASRDRTAALLGELGAAPERHTVPQAEGAR